MVAAQFLAGAPAIAEGKLCRLVHSQNETVLAKAKKGAEASNPYARVKASGQFLELAQSPTTAKDPQFVERFLQFADARLAGLKKNEALNHTVTWTLEILVRYPENHPQLLSFYKRLIQKYGQGDLHLLNSLDAQEFAAQFAKIPEFANETGDLVRLALRAHEESGVNVNQYLTTVFKRLSDVEIKKQIIDHFMKTLFSENRSILHFAYVNKVPQFRKIPIALGPRETLEKFSIRMGAVNYREWELFRWMEDSKSITGFKKAFQIVADQTSAIHFEIGSLIQDKGAFQQAMKTIEQLVEKHGDQYVLDSLAELYEQKQRKGVAHPRLNNGSISITNLEFYWIIKNPQYLGKTRFYNRFKVMSDEDVLMLLAELDLEP